MIDAATEATNLNHDTFNHATHPASESMPGKAYPRVRNYSALVLREQDALIALRHTASRHRLIDFDTIRQ